jgi:cytochrome P450
LVKKVLTSPKCTEKWHVIYSLLRRPGGLVSGKLTEDWKNHRKVLNISFTMSSIENFRKIYDENVKQFCDCLYQENLIKDNNCEIDFHSKFSPTSFRSICGIFFGENASNHPNSENLRNAMRV